MDRLFIYGRRAASITMDPGAGWAGNEEQACKHWVHPHSSIFNVW